MHYEVQTDTAIQVKKASVKAECAHAAYCLGLASMSILHHPQNVRFLSCGASSGVNLKCREVGVSYNEYSTG